MTSLVRRDTPGRVIDGPALSTVRCFDRLSTNGVEGLSTKGVGGIRRGDKVARALLAAALLGALAAPPARASQGQQPAGRPVSVVRLIVDGRPTIDPGLLRLLEVPTGASLLPVQVRESIVHLMAMGRFDDVQAGVEETAAGLAVTFEATSSRKVTQLAFRGDLGLPGGELRAAVVERYTATPALSRADDVARMLETLCRDHGFIAARVTAQVEPAVEPDRATLAFDVNAGPQVRAGKLSVAGEAGLAESEVLARLRLTAGQPFDPVAVRRRANDLADDLRAKGYFEANVTPQVTTAQDGETADVTIAVSRGRLVTLVFVGDRLPPSREADLVPIRREGSVDEDLLEDAQRNIETFFRSQGYRDATASYSPEAAGDQLKLVFTVTRGPRYRVSSIDFAGNSSVPAAELRVGLRLEPGALYIKSLLDADVATVLERYRRRGFAAVKVAPPDESTSSSQGSPDQASIRIRFDIVEGARTLVGDVTFDGNKKIGLSLLQGLAQSVEGRPYYPPQIDAVREAVLFEYLNRGYQSTAVEARTAFSGDRQRVDVTIVIHEGPQILVDHVLIVGNVHTRAQTIERELLIKRGEPLALDRLVESQQRLLALGLFRRVIVTELQHGSETRRDVLVSVEEAPATTFSYGGGLEGSRRLLREGPDGGQPVERFQFAPRGFFDVGRRNLWGKNRTINFFARVSVRPTDPTPDSPAPDATWQGGGLGVSDYRVQANYREPRVIGERSDLTITALSEQGYRSSFNFSRQLGGAEILHRFSPPLTLSGSFGVENTRLFDERFNQQEQLLIDRAFPQVRLSFLRATLAHDLRDDALDPTSGTLTSVDGQFASRLLGSEVGFVKGFAQGLYFHRLPGTRRVVFAGGVRVGLATGFPTNAPVLDADGNPVIGPDGQPVTVVVRDIPASERFYAGGDTTVRAFTRDRLGAPATIDSDGFPHGGMGMIILNGEMRFSVWRWLGAVAFLDVGNVFFRVSDIRLGQLRPALGGGLRLRWPVLPLIRLDVGYNPSPRVFQNGSREKSVAVYFGIGQAF